jgi:hypothetical protein
MEELLANPAVQAGVAPFAAALALAALLHRTRLMVLAIFAAFVVAVTLSAGFSFDPLTATRKLILTGLVAAVAATVFELAAIEAGLRLHAVLAAVGALAAVWIAWRVLQQQDPAQAALWGVGIAAYTALLIGFSLRTAADPVCTCAASLVLGLAAGALALLGSSAQLAQLGIALAAGSGAALLVQMAASRRAPAGWALALPTAVIVAGLGLQSALTGSLPWYSLVPVLAIPWAARVASGAPRTPWLTALMSVSTAAVPMLAAIAIAWVAAQTAH